VEDDLQATVGEVVVLGNAVAVSTGGAALFFLGQLMVGSLESFDDRDTHRLFGHDDRQLVLSALHDLFAERHIVTAGDQRAAESLEQDQRSSMRRDRDLHHRKPAARHDETVVLVLLG
jgi:hypothetical protein